MKRIVIILVALLSVFTGVFGQTNVKDETGATTPINVKDGNVGIGTSSPAAKLHVIGTFYCKGIKLGGFEPDEAYYSNNQYIAFGHPNYSEDFIGYRNNTFYFKDSPGGGDVNDPNIWVGGNITSAKTIFAEEIQVKEIAATNLDLSGNIAANNITIKANSNTADFVFADNYQLKNLADVEAYIKEHKHLPEIPSATDMEASGVNLAEMNKLLLQKIEELTLYTVEQDKKLKEKEAVINKLIDNNSSLDERMKRIEKRLKLNEL